MDGVIFHYFAPDRSESHKCSQISVWNSSPVSLNPLPPKLQARRDEGIRRSYAL